ncbi:ArnT family glycosyltransferase [Mongoliibacter ruber]|uniref:4-amino-4-deoxy-L-arabinose transferase-like glycosyltransferase n=1 Tax=Mongoliibacter ruber TaxID=1750599 RepID=A0A2T0WUJ3_9BACT|nr:hypothetical protein [Mongoliibacter ruber]PRY90350.1 4-amino-4-deoxy-L-arabinose transferase-like glycosyltransferase [Mongoliibacter ruber]
MSQNQIWKEYQFLGGHLFLLLYWYIGYDGITFSDDVTYLNFGQSLWSGEAFPDDSHFGHRWGAFIFSGFFTFLFGFSDRIGSIASLIFVLGTYSLLYAQLRDKTQGFWFTLFFCTQVYFLHFTNKVYPDTLLAFWGCLIPVAAVYRNKYPISMSIIMAFAFIIGFSTKEMMVFLIPFPILLCYFDWKKGCSLKFYIYFLSSSVLVLGFYFAAYQIITGDVLSRFSSVNEGHYISEFTYADKGLGSVIKRLTYLPFTNFVERSYWIWLVFSVPGLIKAFKTRQTFFVEMALAFVCLMLGFWFMSSTLEFYNPIYLNPRHLTILVPASAVLIAFGYSEWKRYKFWIFLLLILGAFISILTRDFTMTAYLLGFALVFFFLLSKPFFKIAISIILILPVILSVAYQNQNKNFKKFKYILNDSLQNVNNKEYIIINDFVFFSKNLIISPENLASSTVKNLKFDIDFVLDKGQPFRLFVYKYYRHAYPDEERYLEELSSKARLSGYKKKVLYEDQWVEVQVFVKSN